jgi:hypothetical protein
MKNDRKKLTYKKGPYANDHIKSYRISSITEPS